MAEGMTVGTTWLVVLLVSLTEVVSSNELAVVSEVFGWVVVVPLSPSCVVVGASVVTGDASCLRKGPKWAAATELKQRLK